MRNEDSICNRGCDNPPHDKPTIIVHVCNDIGAWGAAMRWRCRSGIRISMLPHKYFEIKILAKFYSSVRLYLSSNVSWIFIGRHIMSTNFIPIQE